MTVKQHLAHHHAKGAAFNLSIGTELEKLRKSFEAMETNTSDDDGLKKIYGDAKESVARLSASFMNHAEHHRSLAANAEKAADDELGKRLMPTDVSVVTDPSKMPAGLRAVIRPGQREIQSDMPKVDMQFEHLVKVDD